MPLLTLLIPTYNMERYLAECLDSLLVGDTLMELFEALVIIDGATDGSASVAQRYAKRYPQTFRVIVKENGNYGSCINRGIAEARGKYIRPLDADDRFDNPAFAAFLRWLGQTDADLIISDYATWSMTDGQRHDYRYTLPTSHPLSLIDLCFSTEPKLMMHATTYRTSLLRQMAYHQTEGIFYTDQEWIFLPVTQAQRIAHFAQVLYLYRQGREGQTIDINVWVRHAADEVRGLKGMAESYLQLRTGVPAAALHFMEHRLLTRLEATYRHIFIRSIDAVPEELTRDLDQFILQQLPRLYRCIERQTTYHGLNVIGLWRRWPRLYRLFIMIRRAASRLK